MAIWASNSIGDQNCHLPMREIQVQCSVQMLDLFEMLSKVDLFAEDPEIFTRVRALVFLFILGVQKRRLGSLLLR